MILFVSHLIFFEGGWSDTPPFCLEKGGDIVNMAINLNNKQPITATAKIIPEPVFRLTSTDAGATQDFSFYNMEELFDYASPS